MLDMKRNNSYSVIPGDTPQQPLSQTSIFSKGFNPHKKIPHSKHFSFSYKCLHYRECLLLTNLDPRSLSSARHFHSFLARDDAFHKEQRDLRLRCMRTPSLVTAVAMFLGLWVVMEAEHHFPLHNTLASTLYNESISRKRTYLHRGTSLRLIQRTNFRVLSK
jgi:hypothetical protein